MAPSNALHDETDIAIDALIVAKHVYCGLTQHSVSKLSKTKAAVVAAIPSVPLVEDCDPLDTAVPFAPDESLPT
jgi:hypothetical protein